MESLFVGPARPEDIDELVAIDDDACALYTLHTAPKPLGAAAQRAGARRLLLGHLAPAIESNLREALRSVSASYRGPIVVARDGLRVPVRAPQARSSR